MSVSMKRQKRWKASEFWTVSSSKVRIGREEQSRVHRFERIVVVKACLIGREVRMRHIITHRLNR